MLNQLNQLKEKNDSFNSRLATLREQTSEESQTISLVHDECKNIECAITALNSTQNEVKNETIELKQHNSNLKQKTLELTQKLQEHYDLKSKLLSQIVTSPEKFRKQVIEVGQNLQTEQKDSKIAEKKVRDLSAWILNVDGSHLEVSNALETIQELRQDVDRQRSLLAELQQQKQNNAANGVAL
jgi:septation ring formation regulator EzrA